MNQDDGDAKTPRIDPYELPPEAFHPVAHEASEVATPTTGERRKVSARKMKEVYRKLSDDPLPH